MQKTNVMRLCEAAGVEIEIMEYPVDDGRIDALAIAGKLGRPPEEIFKTLVTEGPHHDHFVFVVPAAAELSLKKAASVSGQKSIEMIPLKTLLPLTGYVHGGCSPVGMKKLFPTFIDETAILFDRICVSGGRVGTNIAIVPGELAKLVGAEFADITA